MFSHLKPYNNTNLQINLNLQYSPLITPPQKSFVTLILSFTLMGTYTSTYKYIKYIYKNLN